MEYDGPLTLEEEDFEYLWFAQRFNWPPDVVDRQPWSKVENVRRLTPLWDEAVADAREAARLAEGA